MPEDMRIALAGGTGDLGIGLAVRWAKENEIIIGSRKAVKAQESAGRISEIMGQEKVSGTDNKSAIESADVVFLCVPFEHLDSVTLDLQSSYTDQVVVSPVVPMRFDGKNFVYSPPKDGSAALQARSFLPEGIKIVVAFQTISAAALKDKSRILKGDVLICGDDKAAKDLVAGLVSSINNLRSLDIGPLSLSDHIEGLTPMLLNIARRNRIKDAGIKIIEER